MINSMFQLEELVNMLLCQIGKVNKLKKTKLSILNFCMNRELGMELNFK